MRITVLGLMWWRSDRAVSVNNSRLIKRSPFSMKIVSYLKQRGAELKIRQRLLRSLLAALAMVVLLQSLYLQTTFEKWKLKVDRIEHEHLVWLDSDEGRGCSSSLNQLRQKVADACGSSAHSMNQSCEISDTKIDEIKSEINATACPLVVEKSGDNVLVEWEHQHELESFMAYYIKSLPQASASASEQFYTMFFVFLVISLVTQSLFFGSTTRWKVMAVAALVIFPSGLVRYLVEVDPGEESYLAIAWIFFFSYIGVAMAILHESYLLVRGMLQRG